MSWRFIVCRSFQLCKDFAGSKLLINRLAEYFLSNNVSCSYMSRLSLVTEFYVMVYILLARLNFIIILVW